MLQFVGYNFLMDGNALDPYPITAFEIDKVQVANALFRAIYIGRGNDGNDSNIIPDGWNINTLFFDDFADAERNTGSGTDMRLNAGSIDLTVDEVDTIRIKRRKLGEFDWETIFEKQINTPDDFHFSGEDYFAANDEYYEYAWVTVFQGQEGNYITNNVKSQFNGVFICDADTIYKFYAGVAYGPSQQTQLVGIYNPIGQKYPIYVTNGATNYQTGVVTAKIVGNYEDTGVFDRKEMVQQKNELVAWLTNKKAKILKDWNGNMWLCFITGAPNISYDSQWGNGMMEISFQYGEVGDPNNADDMRNVGLWPTLTN